MCVCVCVLREKEITKLSCHCKLGILYVGMNENPNNIHIKLMADCPEVEHVCWSDPRLPLAARQTG